MLAAGNAQHLGAREAQQDAFGFSDLDEPSVGRLGALCVVCDGMGGHAGGAEASAAATAAFLSAFRASADGEAAGSVLQRALDAANEAVLDAGRRAGAEDAGTTLAAAWVRAGSLHWISVGDTRIALFRDGRLFQVNRDHNFRVELLRRAAAGDGRRDDALHDPQGDHLTSSLGVRPVALVDRSHRGLPLQPGDRVLVMSDGVYRALPADEIVRCMADDPHAACESVLGAVLARRDPNQDNATIVAIDAEPGRRATTAHDRRGDSGERAPAPDTTDAASQAATDAARVAREAARRRRRLLGAGAVALLVAAALGYWLRPGPAGDAPAPAPPAADAPGRSPPPARAPGEARSRDLPPDGVAAPADRGSVAPRSGDRKATSP